MDTKDERLKCCQAASDWTQKTMPCGMRLDGFFQQVTNPQVLNVAEPGCVKSVNVNQCCIF